MRVPRLSTAALLMVISSGLAGSALAQQTQQQPTSQQSRPNILFIMGDDIGWMQPSI
jgi:arylsulfatase